MNKLLAFLLLAPVLASAHQEYDYVRLPESAVTQKFAEETGFIADHGGRAGYIFGYLPKGMAPQMLDGTDTVVLDTWEWATKAHDPKTLEPINIDFHDHSRDVVEPFHTYETLTEEVQNLTAKYPNLVKLESAGKSVESRELWLMRITSQKLDDPDKPKLIYISSMHGDEVTGKEMLIYFARELTSKYGTDARITALLDNAEIFLLPSMNPDGTERKQRWNANGVDLNRNFPEMNEEAFSMKGREIETQHLMNLHLKHRFPLAMNFHGGALCVNLPWDHRRNSGAGKFGDDQLMVYLAKDYAKANKPMWQVNTGTFVNGITYGYEWYQVLGGMQDWAAYFRDAVHATLEISDVKWPSANTLAKFWNDNRESLVKYLEGGMMGLHLKVYNGDGQLVPNVSVEVGTSTRALKYTGAVHRITIPGEQNVTIKAPGYRTKTLTLSAEPFRGEYRSVSLENE